MSMKNQQRKQTNKSSSRYGGDWRARDPNHWELRCRSHVYRVRKVHMVNSRGKADGHIWVLWGYYDPVGILRDGTAQDAMRAADDYIRGNP